MFVTLTSFILVLCAFGLKTLSVGFGARILRPYFPDTVAAWLASWILIFAFQITAMLVLSVVGILTTAAVWAGLAVTAGTLAVLSKPRPVPAPPPMSIARTVGLGGAVFGIVWTVMALRSSLLTDFTHDASTYGLVRLAVWLHGESILVHMPTEQINIFSNEWNGELNGLLYGLVSGNIQGFAFGNVEILLVTFVAAAWLAYRLGAEPRLASAVGALATLTPAALGLAGTIKGDLLACTGLILAAGWLTLGREKGHGGWCVFLTGTSLALAFGAKISSLFGALLFLPPLLVVLWLNRRSVNVYVGAAIALPVAGIFCSRYFVNLAVYGDALSRAGSEAADPGFHTLLENISLLSPLLVSFSADLKPYSLWALMGGLGLAGVAATICAVLAGSLAPRSSRPCLTVGALGLVGALLTFTLIPAQIWGLRYSLPSLTILLIAASASVAGTSFKAVAATILPILAMVNVLAAFRPGEIFPNLYNMGSEGLRWALHTSAMDRAYTLHPGLYNQMKIADIGLDQRVGRTVVVYQRIDSFILPLFGSRAQNEVTFTLNLQGLEQEVVRVNPDYLVVRTVGAITDEEKQLVSRLGYILKTLNAPFIAARKWEGPNKASALAD
jgi:hypothetical protein